MSSSDKPDFQSASEHGLRLERDGDILLAIFDNPPVNALAHRVRKALSAAVYLTRNDDSIRALLLLGAGECFSAGADIREFDSPKLPPHLSDVCHLIESCSKPVIAAIAGVALGGGLEVALAAHYRLAVPGASLGLPEVRLGLLPGAGGTQRTPRLIGAAAALELMLNGQPITAERALTLGLIDRMGLDARTDGLRYARELLENGAVPRSSGTALSAPAAIAAARAELSTRFRGQTAPGHIIDCVEAAFLEPFSAGYRTEAEMFRSCLRSPQHQALAYAFFAERTAGKVAGEGSISARPCIQAGVIGGGTMGSGIAVALLNAGLRVVLLERDPTSLAAGLARVRLYYDQQIDRHRIATATRTERLERLTTTTDYHALADADLIIEAIYEDLPAKQAVFRELDRICRPGALLASNTSYLDIAAIAAVTGRPQDVIGLHFFSPAPVMRLIEVVVPPQAAPDAVASGFALARRLGKVAVRAGVCDGFIGNRMLSVYRRTAEVLLANGASPYQIDDAIREFGFAMGPFLISDLAGGDIAWATRRRQAPARDPRQRYVPIADRLCERGWFGQKTGRGWYRYENGARAGQPDREVLEIIDAERAAAGITPRAFSNEEIARYYLAAMINEGANIVHEGIALRPLDIDVVLLNGYGFPRYLGGPMHYADRIGLDSVLTTIDAFAAEDPWLLSPSPLLLKLIGSGKNFAGLNVR